MPTNKPDWHLHRALHQGLQLVAVDPRSSEIARKARYHLQPRPGEDGVILAGLIRIVLEEGLNDDAFVVENARGLDPKLTQTARLADYVIAAKLVPEIPTLTYEIETLQGIVSGWATRCPTRMIASAELDYCEPYSGLPRSSAIPVDVAPLSYDDDDARSKRA